ncbi:MAG: hypothetical protein MUF54_23235 [Polyangiaceae bacterium]|nr:hypothetical protein [Polyangiaceae bacterium]
MECFYDGAAMGYELHWGGKRAGMEPTWSDSQGQNNCQWNRTTYGSTKIVECTYNGVPIR